jgi:hypothetical protein
MPVKTYVYREPSGRAAPPTYSHETSALIDIVKRIWLAFQQGQETLALVANLQEEGMSKADLAMVSERGLGVVELKHYTGLITRIDNTWYAGSGVILSLIHI